MDGAYRSTANIADTPLPWVLFGSLLGLFFVIASQVLTAKWFFFVFLAIVIAGISLIPMKRKEVYLAVLVLSIPMGIDANLLFHRSEVHHSTHGFLISLYYLPLAGLLLLRPVRSMKEPGTYRPLSKRGLPALAAWLVAGLISIFLSGNFLFGTFDLFASLVSVLLFIYVSSDLTSRRDFQIVFGSLAVCVAVEGLIALAQHLTDSTLGLEFLGAYTSRELRGDSHTGLTGITRVGGTIGHPNALALFFDLIQPLSVSLLFVPLKARTRVLLLLTILAGALGLTVTLSRGGMLIEGAICLTIALVWFRDKAGLFRSVLICVVVVTMVLAIALRPSGMIYKRFMKDDYQAARGRIPLMTVAKNMIKDKPLFGVGLNNYSTAAPKYDTTPEWISSSWNVPVHNIFMYTAAEIGLFGLASFMAFLLAVFRSVWPAIRSRDPFLSWSAIGTSAGLLGFMAHLQTEFTALSHNALFWLMCGIAVALGRFASSSCNAAPAGAIHE